MPGGQLATFSHAGDEEGWGVSALSSAALEPRTEARASQSLGSRTASYVRPVGKGARAGERVTPPAEDSAPGPVASHPTGHPAYSQTLPREPRSAAVARRLVRTALTVWGLDPLIEDATLVITELVSNAVDHGRLPSIRVIVSRPSANVIRLGVVDRSKIVPTLRTDADEDRTRGRGLLLVDMLTDRWGTERYRWGKQVWAEMGEGETA
ncbi:ATP-binding protein [Streptomyces sp. NPDC007872]|uniref:ATP-binding protein n=1 Tax=Streptomyces sp. NPDC007872 TaxID=3364782 RepID=UPI00368A0EE7